LATLRSITLYPVKSLRGIEVESWPIGSRGLEGDRRWMLVDESGTFVTQRAKPELARIATALDGDQLRLQGKTELVVPRTLVGGPARTVTVWSSTVSAIAWEPARAWLREELGDALELVYMPDSTERAVNPKYAEPGDVVSFADACPILVTTTSSLDDLAARLKMAVSMRRFRPNLVVDGTRAWAEDDWRRVRIGGTSLRIVKPCERCTVITIDPDSEAPAKSAEPLATLATFRQRDGKVLFGQNAIADAFGMVRVGDVVFIE
jgi:uncharacterized protein YcbX